MISLFAPIKYDPYSLDPSPRIHFKNQKALLRKQLIRLTNGFPEEDEDHVVGEACEAFRKEITTLYLKVFSLAQYYSYCDDERLAKSSLAFRMIKYDRELRDADNL